VQNAAGMKAIVLGLVAHLAACTTAPAACAPDDLDCEDSTDDGGKADGVSAASGAQMNDMTIVVPLAKTQAEADGFLAATTPGIGGALLSKTLYTKQFPDPTGSGGVGSDVQMTYANLRVVAIRFDPCFAQIGPITDVSKCDNQIRLVFQSVSFDANGGSAIDGAVHAFYRLDHEDLISAVREVIALRKAQGQTKTMGPLAPHPLLVKQGVDGAFAQGLAQIVLKYCGSTNLIRFTHFQSSNLQTVWGFSGFDIASGKATPMVIPSLPTNTISVSFFAGFAAPIAGGFTPETKSTDDVAVLANITNAKAATKTVAQAAFDATLRIENPGMHSPNTIDCASCHVAQSARDLIGEDILDISETGNSNAFKADPKWVSARSMKETTSPRTQSGLNVHMLSYKFGDLMIGQRVINETANLVAYMNGVVFH
jgi:hypothetical protein